MRFFSLFFRHHMRIVSETREKWFIDAHIAHTRLYTVARCSILLKRFGIISANSFGWTVAKEAIHIRLSSIMYCGLWLRVRRYTYNSVIYIVDRFWVCFVRMVLIKYADCIDAPIENAKQWKTVTFFVCSSFASNALFCEVPAQQMSANRTFSAEPMQSHFEQKRILRTKNAFFLRFFFSESIFWNNTRDALRNQHDVASLPMRSGSSLSLPLSLLLCLRPWATTKGSIMMKDKHQKLINYILCTILAECARSRSHSCISVLFVACVSCSASPEIDFLHFRRWFVPLRIFCLSAPPSLACAWTSLGCRTIQILFFSFHRIVSSSVYGKVTPPPIPINYEFEYFVVCIDRRSLYTICVLISGGTADRPSAVTEDAVGQIGAHQTLPTFGEMWIK